MCKWVATVTWPAPAGAYDSDRTDLLLAHLAGHDPRIDEVSRDTASGASAWAVRLSVEAHTLRQATVAALDLVETTVGERALAVQIQPPPA